MIHNDFADQIKSLCPRKSVIEMGNHFLVDAPDTRLEDYCDGAASSWVSLDLDGHPASMPVDLGFRDPSRDGAADIIVNGGTLEHVESQQRNYNAWHNAWAWLAVGGTAFHLVPMPGTWRGHCRYYYPVSFFLRWLGADAKTKIIEPGGDNEMMLSVRIEKLADRPFMSREDYYRLVDASGEITDPHRNYPLGAPQGPVA